MCLVNFTELIFGIWAVETPADWGPIYCVLEIQLQPKLTEARIDHLIDNT